MSATSKGNANELAAQRYLEERGFFVHRTVRTGRWVAGRYQSQANDIFGLFDLIAVAPGSEPVRLVQVTTKAGASERRIKIRKEAFRFPVPSVCSIEVWSWHKGRKKRGKDGKFMRRQYFRQQVLEDDIWKDYTPEQDGWID